MRIKSIKECLRIRILCRIFTELIKNFTEKIRESSISMFDCFDSAQNIESALTFARLIAQKLN